MHQPAPTAPTDQERAAGVRNYLALARTVRIDRIGRRSQRTIDRSGARLVPVDERNDFTAR